MNNWKSVGKALLQLQPKCRACNPSKRWLSLHEHQSKQLLRQHGACVQRFFVARSPQEARDQLNNFHANEYVIKAQILAGGRGKGKFTSGLVGGVKFSKNADEVVSIVGDMVGQRLVTKQTGPNGVLVRQVMVAESIPVLRRECYLAILLDRQASAPVIMASSSGGVDIEQIASTSPDSILKENVPLDTGVTHEQAARIAESLHFNGDLKTQVIDHILNLYQLFMSSDCTQIEINPLSETDDGKICCVDAKLSFDDNASFRQRDIFAMADQSERDAAEVDAESYGMNYINLDGDIACLVNGAGLAMATMDTIQLHGGTPANFLDVGGRVNEEAVYQAFRIITSDVRVRAILVNIFGGIVNCALVARGITQALQRIQLHVPLIVRLQGTASDEAQSILSDCGHSIIKAVDLDDAAQLAVAAARGAENTGVHTAHNNNTQVQHACQ